MTLHQSVNLVSSDQIHHSTNGEAEPCFLYSKDYLDKGLPLWEGGFHHIAIPIFYDGGGDMKEVNCSGLFDLGQLYNILLLPNGPLGEYAFVPKHCITLFREFSKVPFANKLPHSVKHGLIIADEIERWTKTPDLNVTPNDKQLMAQHLDQFRTLLRADLTNLCIIVLEEIRGYSVSALWKNQFVLMPKGVPRHLSKFVKSNLIESAKCLVLNCYTAVGFHAMRSIEHVSRKYYQLVKGKAPIKPNGEAMGLGSIAQEFIDLKKSSDDLGIIGSIVKGLCKKKRDPLAHPEIVALKKDEAIDTFVDTLQVISKVIEDAKTRGPHFVTPWKRGYLF